MVGADVFLDEIVAVRIVFALWCGAQAESKPHIVRLARQVRAVGRAAQTVNFVVNNQSSRCVYWFEPRQHSRQWLARAKQNRVFGAETELVALVVGEVVPIDRNSSAPTVPLFHHLQVPLLEQVVAVGGNDHGVDFVPLKEDLDERKRGARFSGAGRHLQNAALVF